MITPADLSLPEKFKQFRQNQLEIAIRIRASAKYAFLLDSPTGSGKSIIAATVQKLLNENIVYLCSTKQLQDQLVVDFPYARVLKGRSNYRCNKFYHLWPDVTAEMCNSSKDDDCGYKNSCEYYKAKRAALAAPIAVLNISYFLSEINFAKSFSGSKYVVIDEYDTLEDHLMSFIELSITQYQLKALGVSEPQYKTKFESWIPWAEQTINIIEPKITALKNEMDNVWHNPDPKEIRHLLQLERLSSKLRFFVSNVNDKWVWYPSETAWTFKPIWISPYADNAFWKHIVKCLGMSATILAPAQSARNVGLTEYEYLAMPSPFPKENRPVIYRPCGNIVKKDMPVALPQLARELTNILAEHPTEKGLVHTVSYDTQRYLMEHVKSDRLISHETKDKVAKLEEFKKSDRPLFMLSPSMDRGVDLPYDLCRVVVICKVPFPNLGDPQISKRLFGSKDGQSWYNYNSIKTLIQMAGRGVRAIDDSATTYILDSQFERLYRDNSSMFPNWFKEAVIL